MRMGRIIFKSWMALAVVASLIASGPLRAEVDWPTADWPAVFMEGGAGQQMLVQEIELSLGQVATRSEPKSRDAARVYQNFLIGPHLSICDLPYAKMLVLVEAVRAPGSDIAKGLIKHLRDSGSNSVRLYDAYWWDPLGPATTYPIMVHFGLSSERKAQQMIDGTHYTDARPMFDFLSGNGFDVVLTVATIYYDPQTKKVYSTREVADNVDGVLAKAAERNGATLARWWAKFGHGRRLILEIGNEGIGYGKDPGPDVEQYARIVVAFTKAIKRANPKVEVAMVTRGSGQNANYEYAYDSGRIQKLLEGCREVAPLMDHAILHLYDNHKRDWGVTYPSDSLRSLDLLTHDLRAGGFKQSRIMITEYAFDLWSPKRDTVAHAVANASRQIAIASHPYVSGMFIHQAPRFKLFSYSNGTKWSLSLPTSVLYHNKGSGGHLPDSRGEQLGPRFRMLPTGYAQQLLARACRGRLLDAYAMDNFGQLAYLMTREGKHMRVLISNNQPEAMQVRIPRVRDAKVRFFAGESWDSAPTDELRQPYGITTKRPAGKLNHVVAPAFSVVLVEGKAW